MNFSKPFGLLFVLWLTSVAALFLKHQGADAWQGLALPIILLGLSVATNKAIPRANRPEYMQPRDAAPRLAAQFAVILGVVVLTAVSFLGAHGLIQQIDVPVWSPLLRALSAIGAATFIGSNQTLNFGSYALVPGVVVFLLGAKIAGVGFARAVPAWIRAAAIWLVLPAIGWVFAFISFHATVGFMLFQLLRNLLSNGFSEEFLFRGLLFTRLRMVMQTEWAMITQALIFGLWHFGADYAQSKHDLVITFATMIGAQTVFGYAMAWLMLKTRSIALPTLFHLSFDSLGDAFGMK